MRCAYWLCKRIMSRSHSKDARIYFHCNLSLLKEICSILKLSRLSYYLISLLFTITILCEIKYNFRSCSKGFYLFIVLFCLPSTYMNKTITANLLRALNRSLVLRVNIEESSQNCPRDFGYGIKYQTVSLNLLDSIQRPFITDMFGHSHLLEHLDRDDITIVIHDPGEISPYNKGYFKK